MSDTQRQSGNGMSAPIPTVLLIPASAGDTAALERTLASVRSAAWLSHQSVVIWPFGQDSQSASAIELLGRIAKLHFPKACVSSQPGFDEDTIEVADILLVASGSLVPDGWDVRLKKAAHSFCRVGAVSALDGRDIAAAVLARKDGEPSAVPFDLKGADAAAFALGDRAVYDSPALSSACAYLRNDALRALTSAAGTSVMALLADFPSLHARLTFSGWRVCVADFCVVSAGPGESPGAGHPDPEVSRIFAALNPLSQQVLRIADFISEGATNLTMPGLDERPVVLHVVHSWGGGTEKWVHDFCGGDATRIHLLLTSVQGGSNGTQRLRLTFPSAPKAAVREWDLTMPIRSISPGLLEYERVLQEVIRDFSVDAIVVSSLIGHSLALLQQDVRTLWICHDYLPLCQSIFPFFDGPCERCTIQDLGRCQKQNPLNVEFRSVAPDQWDALRKHFIEILLERRPKIVAPTFSVIEGMKKLDPRMGAIDINVIPHGIDNPVTALPISAPVRGEKLRLAVLGRVNAFKGEQILRELVPMLDSQIELTLVGCGPRGEKLAEELGLRAIPTYEVDELEGVFRSLAPHAGLLLSTYPETFSYTLSELQVLGIPPIATNLGAFAERIEHGKTGLLFEPSAIALIQLLGEVLDQPEVLLEVSSNLRTRKQRRSVADMIADYQGLLPTGSLEMARFEVGQGKRTTILADYAHLATAYRSLHESYDQLEVAYHNANNAYLSTREAYELIRDEEQARLTELNRITELVGQVAAVGDQLKLSWQWWHAPLAGRLISALAENVSKSVDVPSEPSAGPHS